jgi:MoxR-like ATPase
MIHPMAMHSIDVNPGRARFDPPSGRPADLEAARQLGLELIATVDHVLAGGHGVAEIGVACLLSRGHLLIDDIPGVGKTLLAQVLAAAVGGPAT